MFFSLIYTLLGDHHQAQQLMSQSLIIHPPFRRIRHPELTPIIPRDRDERVYGTCVFILLIG